jgi:hypothetical protein
MNQDLETYFVALLTAAGLPNDPEIFPGTSAELRVPENHAVLCVVDTVEKVIAGLHKAQVRLAVSSPTDSRDHHKAIAAAIKTAAEGTLPTNEKFTVGGWITRNNITVPTDDGRWVTTLEGMFALDWTGEPGGD